MKQQHSKYSGKKIVNKKQARKPLISALEPRLLLDGAAVATAVDVLTDSQLHDAFQTDASLQDTDTSVVIAPTEVRAVDPSLNNGKKEVVFIESNVADYQSLIDGVNAGVEIVLLDSTQDGLAQMALWAQTHSGYDAISLISHGAEAQVNLGGFSLDAITVNTRSADLAQLGAALNEDGDLLLYGCSVASGEGQDFITALAQATQADVAASDDVTGAVDKGGDWVLEKQTGQIEAEKAISDKTLLAYDHFLALPATGTKTFNGTLGANDSGSTGFKSYTDGGNLLFNITNNWTTAGGELYGPSSGAATQTLTIKADGTNVGTFSVGEISLYSFNSVSYDFTLTFKDSGGTTIGTPLTKTAFTAGAAQTLAQIFGSFTQVDNVAEVAFSVTVANGNMSSFTVTDINLPVINAPSTNPTVTGVTSSTSDGSYKAGDTISVQVGFSEAVTVSGTPQLTLETGTTDRTLDYVSGSGGTSLTFNYTVQAGDTAADLDYLSTSALALNSGTINATSGGTAAVLTLASPGASGSLGDSKAIVIDTTAPTVASIDRQTPSTSTTEADSVVYRVTFDEAVSGIDTTDFSVNGTTATVTSVSSAGGNAYDVTVSGGDIADLNATVTLSFAGGQNITDAASNALTATTPTGTNNTTYDVVNAPTVTTGDNTDDNLTFSNYTADLADGGGLSLVEALHYASANQTVAFNLASGTTVDLNAQTVAVASGITFDTDAMSALTISNGTLTLGGDTTFTNGTSDTLTVSSVLAGSGALTKLGAGALTLSGTNSYTGVTTVSAGTLAVAGDSNLGTGSVSLGGGTFQVTGTTTIDNAITMAAGSIITTDATTTLSGVISGSNTLTKTGTGTLKLTNTSNSGGWSGGITVSAGTLQVAADTNLGTGILTLDGGTLQNTVSTSPTLSHDITLGADGGTLFVANGDLTISGVITGTGALTKLGGRLLTLSGANDFSGGFNVSGSGDYGTSVTDGSNLGTGAVTLSNKLTVTGSDVSISNAFVLNGGSIVNANGVTLSGVLSGSGALTKAEAGSLTLSGTNTYTGTTTVSAGTLIGTTSSLTGNIANNSAVEFSQSTDGTYAQVISGTGAVTKSGTGTVTLSGVNTYTGTTAISAGGLTLNNASGTALADTGAVTLSGTAALTLATNETIGSLAGSGTVNLSSFTLNAGGNNNSGSFSGVISGTGGLTKAGSGELTLSSSNTYTGATTVSAGILVASGGSAIADTSAVTVASGATFRVNDFDSETVGSIAGAGNISANGGTLTVGGDNTSTTFSGVISDYSEATALIKAGSGTLTLSGSNTYSGTTSVSGGTLSISADSNLGAGALTLNSGTLSVTGDSATIDNAITLGSIGGTIEGTNTNTLSGVISGTGSLTKSGAGTVTLSGTNTYTGATNVSAGTLSVTGALAATSGVTVSSGATLAGSGSVFAASSTNDLTVNSGGFLAPGVAGAGTLTVNGDLILNGTLNADITGTTAGSGYDQVVVTGDVTLGANSAFDVTYSASGSGNTFVLINNQGANGVSGTLSGVAEGGTLTSNDRGYQTSYVGGTGNDVTLTDNSAPVVTSGATGSVDENAATSTVIYTATATDADNDTLTYSLTGTDADLLSIDASTGEVTLNASADYETKSSYSFNVVATDTSSQNSSKAVIVSVNDLNDNTPVITSGATGSVDENAATNTVIYTVTATDADGTTANNTLTYSLTGTDASLLDINASTGVVTLKASANYETKSSYSFNVVATDNGTGSLNSDKAITVSVNDVNEAPVITSGATGSVDENAATSTVIYTATSTDVDNDTVIYSLTGTDAALLSIDASSGAVTLNASADFETKSSYSFSVVATDNGTGTLTDTQAVTVSVNDVNEAPVITSGATGSVNENVATSTVIYTATATDADSNTVTYSLAGADAALLSIDASSGAVTLNASADYETKSSYSFNVVATDNGTGTLTDTQAVTVSVNDLNDNTPVITSGATGSVDENAATSTVIYTVTGTDADGTATNNTLTYSLTGTDASLLSIDASTGEVTLNASADYESKTSYSFNVVATDNGAGNFNSGSLSVSKAITVSVNDVNDNAPVITSGATGSVDENAVISTVIYTATATDADGTSSNNTLTYSLTGTDASLLDINASTGVVTLKASADFETKSSYSFNVVATDNGTGTLTDTQAVTVSVNDVNDAPVITSGATGSVNENVATSTVIYTATATDADSNTVTYSLTGTDVSLLDINASTGVVTLKASADYETKSSYSFNVVATDNGTGTLTDTQAVTVSVNDLNDNTPVITSGATGSVDENAATSTVIYTVTGTDADGTSTNNTLTYSLTGTDASLLDINASTGVVTLKASADYESKTSYSFNVVATDNGAGNFNSGSLSVSKAITVSVNDVNDNAPVITSGATGSVDENAVISTVIYTATATDADSNTVTYSLTGTDASLLDINASTGVVTLKASADFETKSSYSFSVVATDNGTGSLTDTQAVTVSVNNVNEAPIVTGTLANMTGTSGQTFTPVILPANLFTDPDANETAQLVWSIENLPTGLVFNATTHTISGTPSGGFEGINTLQIVATDPNGAQVKAPVTLTLAPAPAPPQAAPAIVAPTAFVPTGIPTSPLNIDVAPSALTPPPIGTITSTGGTSGFVGDALAPNVVTGNASPVAPAPAAPAPVAPVPSEAPAAASSSSVAVNVGADGRVQVTQAAGVAANTTGLTVATMVNQANLVSIALADTSTAASYSGTMSDGTNLPSWVVVNPTTGEVTMTPPEGQGKITLKINAVDVDGTTRVLEIQVDLANLPASTQGQPVDPATTSGTDAGNGVAFMSLDDQLTVASQSDEYGSGLMKLLAS